MRLFPGDPRVWRAAAAAALVLVAVGAVALAWPRSYFTGTNSVTTRSYVVEVAPGSTLCIPELEIPAATKQIALDAGLDQRPAVRVEVIRGAARAAGTVAAGAGGRFAVPLSTEPRPGVSRLCVTPRGRSLILGGMIGLAGPMTPPTLDGAPLDARIAVWFLPDADARRSLAALLPEAVARAALYRPPWVGPWTYVLLLCVLTPGLLYASVRVLARSCAGAPGGMRPAVAIALIAAAGGATWATLTPPFDAPDEPDHFAYVQSLVERGARPAQVDGPPRFHSTHQSIADEELRLYSYVERPDGRPPWTRAAERKWNERAAGWDRGPPRDDGGGRTTAATHQAPYYLLGSLGYLAAGNAHPWTQLWAVRLVSAVLGAVTAFFVVLFVSELLRGREVVAVVGGVLVAMLPMFTFISGAVNNDMGVNAMAAITLYLAARALRRGLRWQLGLALGAALALMPVFKATGYALFPAVAVALAGSLWRRHDRGAAAGLAVLAAAFMACRWGWDVTGGRIPFTYAPDAAGDGSTAVTGAGSTVSAVLDRPRLFLSYTWQTFLPRLPFMEDLFVQGWPANKIYVKRGFGAFGWYAILWPEWVYRLIIAALAVVAALCASALWRLRRPWRTRVLEAAFVVLAVGGVLGGVAAAYMTDVARPDYLQPEQGRYAFTVLAPLATVAGMAVLGLGRRATPYVAAVLVVAAGGLQLGSQLLGMRGFFT